MLIAITCCSNAKASSCLSARRNSKRLLAWTAAPSRHPGGTPGRLSSTVRLGAENKVVLSLGKVVIIRSKKTAYIKDSMKPCRPSMKVAGNEVLRFI